MKALLLVVFLAAVSAASAASAASKATTPAQQCGVVYGPDYCDETFCYITIVNSSCAGGEYSAELEPVCDARYYVSFVVTLGDSLFSLYESPEAEANGYATYEDALKWGKSVGELVPCVVTNTSAYVAAPVKPRGNGHNNDALTRAILGIVIAVSVTVCLIALAVLTVIVVIYAVKVWKTRKSEVVV